MRITLEAIEKPPNWSLFEANRLNSPKLGVKFFDRLINYTYTVRKEVKHIVAFRVTKVISSCLGIDIC